VDVLDGPGLGIEVDEDRVRRHRVPWRGVGG
jgi:L-alanine-DL-glutamate epimerase-like enolase superfamily enzyme